MIPESATINQLKDIASSDPFTGRRVEMVRTVQSGAMWDWEEWGEPDKVQLEYLDDGKLRWTRWIEVVK